MFTFGYRSKESPDENFTKSIPPGENFHQAQIHIIWDGPDKVYLTVHSEKYEFIRGTSVSNLIVNDYISCTVKFGEVTQEESGVVSFKIRRIFYSQIYNARYFTERTWTWPVPLPGDNQIGKLSMDRPFYSVKYRRCGQGFRITGSESPGHSVSRITEFGSGTMVVGNLEISWTSTMK